ncbi:3-hydroxyacyl-ACP dehydratase FabZ family protein [Lentiprolixibacter aurantiacus]|uniref:Beta-hydroxyacyl-ACP dehydratase n=1 Tax=Lentiprolixibacter aurantiacus TaxID=2993939 RepID=A0AAE3MKW7_9FLAO|nr:3-hydroxyacyl-ACP dehydratase FabZ family protein [Lentiprolixibacter aurantiacus]MCX2719645.1 beta-hydroxyacyl-ACP dehydratase [Lentiprolixibacter aurantiacus]
MEYQYIISQLPYSMPFLFVDSLEHVDEDGVTGSYTFSEDLHFYEGHFKSFPVTPGVLLTECCAQIGLVCLGIFLMRKDNSLRDTQVALSSSSMEFLLPIYPGETVTVKSEKIYFRFQKLKCKVYLYNEKEQLVCKGEIAGMLTCKGNE